MESPALGTPSYASFRPAWYASRWFARRPTEPSGCANEVRPGVVARSALIASVQRSCARSMRPVESRAGPPVLRSPFGESGASLPSQREGTGHRSLVGQLAQRCSSNVRRKRESAPSSLGSTGLIAMGLATERARCGQPTPHAASSTRTLRAHAPRAHSMRMPHAHRLMGTPPISTPMRITPHWGMSPSGGAQLTAASA
jgi:hypothetical protein